MRSDSEFLFDTSPGLCLGDGDMVSKLPLQDRPRISCVRPALQSLGGAAPRAVGHSGQGIAASADSCEVQVVRQVGTSAGMPADAELDAHERLDGDAPKHEAPGGPGFLMALSY